MEGYPSSPRLKGEEELFKEDIWGIGKEVKDLL